MGSCLSHTNVTKLEIAIKFPNGLNYQYYSNGWKSDHDINNFISKLYFEKPSSKNKWTNWIVYNNQVLSQQSPQQQVNNNHLVENNSGHCKGILAWRYKKNRVKYSWLIHSIPNFPTYFSETSISTIQKPQERYGQSLVYVKGEHSDINVLIDQLMLMKPNIISYNCGNTNKISPTVLFPKNLTFTKLSNDIEHIAKAPQFNVDIYDILACKYGYDCYVETWLHGTNDNIMPETPAIRHVKYIKTDTCEFKESQDHSKWAISANTANTANTTNATEKCFLNICCSKSDKWIFIGDLNRMNSQKHRGGGGILIFNNKKLWKAFHDIIYII